MRKDIACVTLIYSELIKKPDHKWKFQYKDLNKVIRAQSLIAIKSTPYIRKMRSEGYGSPVWEITETGRNIAEKTLNAITADEIKEILYG